MPENNYYQTLPKKRIAAGALFFNENNELLIVKPTYKDYWQIPGGVVEKDESPRDGCIREVKEEIGLDIDIKKFLCADYIYISSEEREGIIFIFYGGILTPFQIENIKLPKEEISECKFLKTEEALPLLSKIAERRIAKSLEVLKNDTPVYSENFN